MNTPHLWQIPQADALTQTNLTAKTALLDQRLRAIADEFAHTVLASSLAAEDMVITERIALLRLPIRIITLDTGKLPEQTLALIPMIEARYGICIDVFRPDHAQAAAFEKEHGAHGIYESVAVRKECCRIRKNEPLTRALTGADAWLTGQRREQSVTRSALNEREKDLTHGLVKFNPIFDWREDDIWAYIAQHDTPINALYAEGYPSIGCAPCTMPVKFGDDIRSGRWWWESSTSRECGLHR